MRSLVFGFLLLFNSSVFASTCSDIWPQSVSFPAPAAPTTPDDITYDSQITRSVTYSASETVVAVDDITFNGNRRIVFEGTGTRVLYVKNALNIGGTSSINPAGNVDLVIVVGGSMNISGTADINGLIYVAGSSAASGSATINGSVTSAGATTVTDAYVTYDADMVAAVTSNSACEASDVATNLEYPYSTGFEADNSEWSLSGDFSVSSDASGERAPRTGSYVLDNNSEDIDQGGHDSGHTAETNLLLPIPADAVLPELSFFYKLDALESADNFHVYIYSESTGSWQLKQTFTQEQENADYRFASVDLTEFIGDSIKIRFQQEISSFVSGARLFLVDDINVQDRPIVDFGYPYTNSFESAEADDWYVSADFTISNTDHNNYQAFDGSGYLDNNSEEIDQRRHLDQHWAMMSGFVEVPADADQPTLSFQYKINALESEDNFYVEIQESDSTSWTTLATLSSEDNISHYAKLDLYLDDSYKSKKIRIRFRQDIASYINGARLFTIDQFRIGDKEVDSSLSYPYSNEFETSDEQSVWNGRGDMNISTATHDTDYTAYSGDGYIDNNPDYEDQTRHFEGHLIEMQKYVTLPNEDDIVLNFFYKLDLTESEDNIYIEIQRAGATNWSVIEALSEQHAHDSYTKYEASLAAYKDETIRIRFRQYIASYTSGARLFVADNLYIGPQVDTYFDFPYFNDFETDVSDITINQDDTDDINGRDQWNHEGDWDISGVNDTSVDPERTSFSGDWYLNNNSAFDEDQRRHYINHEMSMAGFIQIPNDTVLPEASFYYKLDVIDEEDKFYFEYQIEGNSAWTLIETFSLQQEHNTYTRYRYDLPDSLKGEYVRFRFRQYITSYTNGVRHFTVDDFRVEERQLESFDYPYFNDFEADVSSVTVDGDDQNDTNGKDHWNHQGDWGISSSSHNAFEARSGDSFADSNPLEEDQRRHYTGHVIEMNGVSTIPSDASEPELTFYYMLDAFDSDDRVFVEIQTADSTSWSSIRTLSFDDEHDVYTKATISLEAYKGDAVRVRFRQYLASYSNGARLFTVDDFRIGEKTIELYDFPYTNGFEDETSDSVNGVNGRDQWNNEGDWYFSDTTHGDNDEASAKTGSWYLDSNRDDEDQSRKYLEQIAQMEGYVAIPSDADSPVLAFDYKLHVLDSDDDDFILEVQELGNTSWDILNRFEGADATSTYQKYVYGLDSYLGKTIRVRFRTYITSYTNGPRYFSIDNFKIGFLTVGYWPLEGNLNDISGRENHAEAGGTDEIDYFRSGPAFTSGAESSCQYVEFTGNNYLTVPDTGDIELTDEYSASIWVYPQPDPNTGSHYTTDKTLISKGQNLELHLNSGQVYWQWGDSDRKLTSTSTLPLEEWTHVAVTYRNGEQNIYINGVLDSSKANTDSVSSSSYAFHIGTGLNSNTGAVLTANNFDGYLDEARIYESFLEQSEIDDDMTTTRECAAVINHVEILHNGSGLACLEHSVTIKLCSNDDCTDLYNGDDVVVTLQRDDSGTISDIGDYTIDGTVGEDTAVTFSDSTVATWNFTATVSDVDDIRCSNSTAGDSSCGYEVSRTGLVITSGNNSVNPSCGVAEFYVQALEISDENPEVCTPTYASGDYPLTFEMNYTDPSSATNAADATVQGVTHAAGTVGSSINVTFDSDAKTVDPITVAYQEAGEISVTVNDAANVLESATATLKFVPAYLALEFDNGTTNKSAGVSDNLKVSGAYCSSDMTVKTENYQASGDYSIDVDRATPSDAQISDLGLDAATLESFKVQDDADVVVVNGDAATFTSSSSSVSINYDEHAQLVIQLSDANYLNQNEISPTGSITANWIPIHYQVTDNIADESVSLVGTTGCSNFNYIGQPYNWTNGVNPKITLTGQNANSEGDTTTHFSDIESNWQFSNIAVEMMSENTFELINVVDDQNESYAPNNGSVIDLGILNLVETNPTELDGARTFELQGLAPAIDKGATVDEEFRHGMNLVVSGEALTDDNDITVEGGTDVTLTIGSDLTSLYGRLWVESSFGSELENLAWVAQLQSYNSAGQWQVNTSDSCTTLTESAITIDEQNEFYFDDTTGYSLDETGAITYLASPSSGNAQTATSGYLILDFAAPSEGNVGGFEIDVNLSSEATWLQWDWDVDGTLDSTLPTTSVIFGRYQGNNRIIYKRER